MEELVKMLVDQGAIVTGGERWTLDADRLLALAVPPTLTGVLQARLDSLPPPERRALQLASVIGTEFWDAGAGARRRAGADAICRRCSARAGPSATGPRPRADGVGEYAFHHQILHQVTYDTVLKRVKRQRPRARRRLAGATTRRARARACCGRGATHYEQAGDAAQCRRVLRPRGRAPAGIYVHERPSTHTARALRLASRRRHRAALAAAGHPRARARPARPARRAAADIDALQALAEAMPPGAEGDARRAEVAWRRADHAHRIGDWEAQEREARRTLALAERAGDVPLALRAIHRLAPALAFRGDPAAGRALAEAALERARTLGLPGRSRA